MYEEFFQLRERPFSVTPDPHFLYLSKTHRRALTMLQYGLTSASGITVVTGEVGCGKTTLVRHLIAKAPDNLTIGLVDQTDRRSNALNQWIAYAFDVDLDSEDSVGLHQALLKRFRELHEDRRRAVLIVDEAQNLNLQTLENLRLLSNINVDNKLVLQLVLIGQPELLAIMKRRQLRQLAQRVSVEYHLGPLTEEEVGRYIRHRLSVAGGDAELFDDAACSAIFHATRGIPRLVNILCDMALVYAFADERQRIDRQLVVQTIDDRQKGGILPLRGVEEMNPQTLTASENTNLEVATPAQVSLRPKRNS